MSKKTRRTLTTGALALAAAGLAIFLILDSLSGTGSVEATPGTGSVEATPAGDGQGALGGDVQDLFMSSGALSLLLGSDEIPVNLNSAGLEPTILIRTPPPYQTGVPIDTEIIEMALAGFVEGVGRVEVRQRGDQPSFGIIQNVVADGGNFVSGDCSLGMFVDIILADIGQVLDTGVIPIQMQAVNVTSLPPLGQDFFNLEQVELFDKETMQSVGFVLDAVHRPDEIFVPPDPDPDQDCAISSAISAITFDVGDVDCSEGEMLSLGQFDLERPATVDLDPPPYTTGTDIQTELVQLELVDTISTLGTVTVRERADRRSRGKIENVMATGGSFVSGDSFFDVFVEVEIPNTGQLLHTGQSTVLMENGGITALPPFQTSYLAPPAMPQIVPLYDTATLIQVGWLCHASHILEKEVECESAVIFADGFESGDTGAWP